MPQEDGYVGKFPQSANQVIWLLLCISQSVVMAELPVAAKEVSWIKPRSVTDEMEKKKSRRITVYWTSIHRDEPNSGVEQYSEVYGKQRTEDLC